MKSTNQYGVIGATLVITGGLMPMLRLPIIGNWNYWDLEPVLASIVYLLSGLALYASVSGKLRLLKFSGWAIFVVVVFTLLAVYFKINDSFSFIPFKKLATVAVSLVKYRWTGWSLLIAGPIFIIIGAKRKSEVMTTA